MEREEKFLEFSQFFIFSFLKSIIFVKREKFEFPFSKLIISEQEENEKV